MAHRYFPNVTSMLSNYYEMYGRRKKAYFRAKWAYLQVGRYLYI